MLDKLNFTIRRKIRERYPALISIELSSVCNAACIMCPHPEMERRKQHMSLDLLQKIVDDCKGKPLRQINLFWFGDSLCHKQIIECLRIVREAVPKVRLNLSTNAEMLYEERSRAIIDENLLDQINFDIDGFKKETFEKIRLKLTHDIVLEKVHYFLDYKKKKEANSPQTSVTIIKMIPTIGEIDDFIKYWKPRVDRVIVNDYNTWLGTQEDRNVPDVQTFNQNGKFDFACIHPWDELVISADGIAGLCCLDYDLTAPVGDVKLDSIGTIWNSDELNNYRRKILKLDYDSIDACRNCNAYIYQKDFKWAKLQRS